LFCPRHLLWGFSLIVLFLRVRETFWRPEVPSGKAKVRSLVVMLGAGIFVFFVFEVGIVLVLVLGGCFEKRMVVVGGCILW
jgi:hypothetical protein